MLNRIIKLSILFVLLLAGYNTASASFTISRPSTNNIGLVGHWTFDGKNVVNGVALDSSGNGYNANLISIATSTFYAAGKIGQGFNFDGVNDYVSIPRINNNEVSVSAWVYHQAADTTNADAIWGGWYWTVNPSNREGFDLRFYTGNGGNDVEFAIESFGATTTEKTSRHNLTDAVGNWHHIVGTYNSTDGNQRLYVDGVLRDTDLHAVGATIKSLTQYTDMRIGHSRVNIGYFNGKIDDVRLYNRPLTAGEVKQLYNQGVSKFNKSPINTLTSGLVGYWTFDGADTNWTANTVTDRSSKNNTGTTTNMSTSTSPVMGKIGQGLSFDGVNDYVIASSTNLGLNGTGAVSVGGWFKISTLSAVQNLMSKQISNGWNTFVLAIPDTTQNSVRFTVQNQTLNEFPQWEASTTIGWHHIFGTFKTNAFDSTDAKIYIDGVSQSTIFTANSYASNYVFQESAQPLIFGVRPVTFVNPYSGVMDDLRIYKRALSAEEVKILYNMGR